VRDQLKAKCVTELKGVPADAAKADKPTESEKPAEPPKDTSKQAPKEEAKEAAKEPAEAKA